MSWATRRQATFVGGIVLVFLVLIAIPTAIFLYQPASCTDGKQNQGETAIDKGGPCPILDERLLAPFSVLWARSFAVQQGNYSAVAYIDNPNKDAGVRAVHYKFGLYDSDNVIVAEREGATFIMPGGVTPVFEYNIGAGNRTVVHTYFEFAEPLVWERMMKTTGDITVNNLQTATTDSTPRISAVVQNTSVTDIANLAFSGVVFDPAGNVFAASRTVLERLNAGESHQIVFTWSEPFGKQVGRVDILPILPPAPAGGK